MSTENTQSLAQSNLARWFQTDGWLLFEFLVETVLSWKLFLSTTAADKNSQSEKYVVKSAEVHPKATLDIIIMAYIVPSKYHTISNLPRRVLLYYIGMCGPKGYVFLADLVRNRISILAILV